VTGSGLSVYKHIDDLYRSSVIHIRCGDADSFVGSVDDASVSHIDGHMIHMTAAAVEYQIPGSGLICGDGPALSGLGGSGTAEIDSRGIAQDISGKAGTVHSRIGIVAAVNIGIAHELKCIIQRDLR